MSSRTRVPRAWSQRRRGSDSPQTYREAVDTLHAAIAQSEIVTLAGQQHVAHHAAPELVAGAILRSLSE